MLVANATNAPVSAALEVQNTGGVVESFAVTLPACSVAKVAFDAIYTGGPEAGARLRLGEAERTVAFAVRRPGLPLYRTFVSDIDASVQRYAVQPAANADAKALELSTHGAGVDALDQARAYGQKAWAHVACPTNRRPFGFDWEGWGRIDALEALADAKADVSDRPVARST